MSTTSPPPATGGEAGSQPKIARKERVKLSCTSCRYRKLKCDRGHPCDKCTKRGQASWCSYSFAPAGPREYNDRLRNLQDSADMHKRLHSLENLVSNLLDGAKPSGEVAAILESMKSKNGLRSAEGAYLGDHDELDAITASLGRVHVEKDSTLYVGTEHWSAILDDILEVKGQLDEVDDDEDDDSGIQADADDDAVPDLSPALVDSGSRMTSRAELIAGVPNRSFADRLVWRFFNLRDGSCIFVHKLEFQKEYKAFWESDATRISLTWLSLLYSILSQGLATYIRTGDEVPVGNPQEFVDFFRIKAAQCLKFDHFMERQNKYTVSACTLYLISEYARASDVRTSIWILMATTTRLAMRMGYHRDPRHYPSISAYDGEMRRRVWAILSSLELLISFQIGLPRMIRTLDSDTALPSNLSDGDFDSSSKTLPPSRPISEATDSTYIIVKGELGKVFGLILDKTAQLGVITEADINLLDAKLEQAAGSRPLYLRIKPLEESMHDDIPIIMQRFNLQLLYLKARIVLHRNNCKNGRIVPKSKTICLDSAMEILGHQSILHRETKPGGHLRGRLVIRGIVRTDFLLAAMFVTRQLQRRQAEPGVHGDIAQRWSDSALYQALQEAHDIWRSDSEISPDSKRACEAVGYMLRKARENCPGINAISPTSNGQASLSPREAQSSDTALPSNGASSERFTPNNVTPATDASLAQMNPAFDYNLVAGNGAMLPASAENFMLDDSAVDWNVWNSVINNGQGPQTFDPTTAGNLYSSIDMTQTFPDGMDFGPLPLFDTAGENQIPANLEPFGNGEGFMYDTEQKPFYSDTLGDLQ